MVQFFPSIDHAILLQALRRKITDSAIIWLVELILASGHGLLDEEYCMVYFPGDDLFAINRPRGLPIGYLTSQFWANVYMNGLDHFIKRELRCPGYVRYVDDLLLFADDKRRLWDWKERLEQRLADLRLTIPFLGFTIFPDRRRLKPRKGINFQRRLQGMLNEYAVGSVSALPIALSIDGWCNHVRYANTVGLVKNLLEPVPQDIRELLHSSRTADP